MKHTLEEINRRLTHCFHCSNEMGQDEFCGDCGERRDPTPLESAEYMERFWKNSGGGDLFRPSREDAKILRIARGEQEAWERDKMGKVFVPAYIVGYLDIAR